MKYRFGCSAALLGMLAFSGATLAQSSQDTASSSSKTGSTKMSSADSKFAMEAAQGGMAEVQLGNLAKDHASSDAVKKFGQRMVDDHSKANDQLKSIASQSGITLPTDIGAKNKAELDRLSKLNGSAFDKAYMQLMVRDHKKDVAEFQKEANSGKDANLKKFAADTVPTLEEHLKMAEETARSTSGSQSADRTKSSENK